MESEKKLTEKEEAFCQSYLIDFNGARAARAAGYSEDSARSIAAENLTKPHIQDRIAELRQQTGKLFNITRERIAQELARIGFADIRNIFNESGVLKSPAEWSDEDAAVIAGIETNDLFEWNDGNKEKIGEVKKLKVWEKTKALEALCRMMGYNEPDKMKVEGQIAIQQITGMEVKR